MTTDSVLMKIHLKPGQQRPYKDKKGWVVLPEDYDIELVKGETFILKVGRKMRKIVVE
jgi:hypothetical protein